MQQYIQKFEEYLLNEEKVSKNTFESYKRDITAFLQYMGSDGIQFPELVLSADIVKYLDLLQDQGRSAATVTRVLSSVRSFYRYMETEGMTEANPAEHIKTKKAPVKPPQILTEEEIARLFAQPNISTPKGIRDKAMLAVLYAAGMRVSEMISLNMQDVNLEYGYIICRKQNSERQIPVYDEAFRAMSDYFIHVRKKYGVTESEALFINFNGKRLTRQGFWKIIKGYAQTADISQEITPKTLRHSFAMHMVENGTPLKNVQQLMGHADISSTQVYARLMKNKLSEVYGTYHPRALKEQNQ